MITKDLEKEYKLISQALFDKNFFHLYHGSLSVRTENDKFLINKKEQIFSEPDAILEVHYQKDMSWNDASVDTYIHSRIYKEFNDIKCIANLFPVNLISYSLYHKKFKPLDYIGLTTFREVNIIDSDYKSWKEQADTTISKAFQKGNVVIIKGTGVFMADRDLRDLAKKASILEHSAEILLKTKDL